MPLDAPVTSAEVNGKEALMQARLGRAASYDVRVRTISLSRASTVRSRLTTLAVVGSSLVLASCGDGIDEGVGGQATDRPATAPTTTEPAVRTLPTLEFTDLELDITDTSAQYSGARTALHLADGSWLAAGYDNHSTRGQPEPGAVWRSDDLSNWTRVGDGISDESGQQVIASLVAVDDRIIAAGTNFVRDDLEADLPTYDADVWVSDDGADSFRKVHLADDAAVNGAAALLGAVYAWGYEFDESGIGRGQIWRSDDHGDSWQHLSPAASPQPGAAVTPLGPVQQVVQWDDTLVAVGFSNLGDPDGSDYPLDEIALGSATETWEPLDITLSYSDDQGASWRTTTPVGLSGVADAQIAYSAAVVGDHLVLSGMSAQQGLMFDPDELIDIDDLEFDPEFDFESPLAEARLWTCDFVLQSCAAVEMRDRGYDLVISTIAVADGLVYAAVTGIDEEPFATVDRLYVFDPASAELRSQRLPAWIDQVNEIVTDGDELLLFGHGPDSDLLQVARASTG